MTVRLYEFYRAIILTTVGVILIAQGNSICTGIGQGCLALAVILHMTTISTWTKEDIMKAIEEKKP